MLNINAGIHVASAPASNLLCTRSLRESETALQKSIVTLCIVHRDNDELKV